MNKYSYPAVLTPEENGTFSVYFPDLEGCYTCGDNITEAIMMAEDVLAFTLYQFEKRGKAIPQPSHYKDIASNADEFINYIACATLYYRKKNSNSAVKKTLTILLCRNYDCNSIYRLEESYTQNKHGTERQLYE